MTRLARSTVVGILAVVVLLAAGIGLAFGVNRKVEASAAAPMPTAAPDPAAPTVIPVPETKKVVLIGDYTADSEGGGSGPRNWTALVGLALQTNQPTRVVRDNAQGSGYVATGAFKQTFLDSAKVLVNPDSGVVVILGSRFDMFAPSDAVNKAAADTYRYVRDTAPDATLVVIGPTWPGNSPPPELLATRDAVRTAATAAGATYIDPIDEGWFADDPGKYMAPDNVYLSNSGHERVALGVYQAILAALQPKN